MKMLYHMTVRLLLSAAGLGLAAHFLDGIKVDKPETLFWAALLLAVANAVVRPVLIFLTLPATILSLGLFLFVINAAMLGLVAWLLPGLSIAGFWPALGAWCFIAILQGAGSLILGDRRLVVRFERGDRDDFRR